MYFHSFIQMKALDLSEHPDNPFDHPVKQPSLLAPLFRALRRIFTPTRIR